MKSCNDARKQTLFAVLLVIVMTFAACSETPQSPDVTEGLRRGLVGFELHNVTVSQDREKGIVTLGGHVASEIEKAQAESLAKSMSETAKQVVVNQITVTPPAAGSDAPSTSQQPPANTGQ